MKGFSPYSVTIYFADSSESIFPVKYRLFDSPMLERWIALMERALPVCHVEDDGHFYGKMFNDEKFLENKLNECIRFINKHLEDHGFSEKKIMMEAKIPMTVQFLNDLHEVFEKLEPNKTINNNFQINKVLQEMNVSIHKAEQFVHDTLDNDHVQVLMVPPLKEPLHDEDYELFDLDYKFGYMYLTYGMTGVPTKDAFIHKTTPTPQCVYSSGMYLCFFEDRPFTEHKQLNEWLKERGLDPNDPKLALGYIPMGKLVYPEVVNQKEFVKGLARYKRIVKVHIQKSSRPPQEEAISKPAENNGQIPAKWPYDSEIFYHLDYRPYIDLGVKFNAKEILEEAQKALAYFVVHRDYDQRSDDNEAKWRSLGLRSLFGDYTKTQYHTSYQFEGKPEYRQTVFAELCPKTMAFLNTITDVNQCERVRFMLLEPGASINVHRDSQTSDTCLAVNISLNMPEGCVFEAGLNADGTRNEHSVILPFKDSGSVLLFNNAKYHTVVNKSKTPRIHIIFHGPIRFTDAHLLSLARNQNQIYSRKELLKKLIKKKSQVGESYTKNPYLLGDWVDSGLDSDSIPSNIKLCVWDHAYIQDEKKKKSLDLITKASLFPMDYETIREEEISLAISKAIEEKRTHLVLIAAGTLFGNLNKHIYSLMSFCQQMVNERIPVAGHIIDKHTTENLPYFHEQYLVINLQEWKNYFGFDLGPLFTKEKMIFPSYSRSPEHFHDDYTPYWIAAGEEVKKREGFVGWGTKVMLGLMKFGEKISNIPEDLRSTKNYAYPRDNNEEAWNKVARQIEERLSYSKNEVYAFNNEKLNIAYYEEINPNVFISVAAGLKPFKIIEQYKYQEGAKFYFLDFSERALAYFKELTKISHYDELLEVVSKYSGFKHGDKAHEISKHHLTSIIRDSFEDNPDLLLSSIKKASKSVIRFEDLVRNENALASLLEKDSRFVIWVSNAFYNNSLYFILTKEEAQERYLKTIKKIAAKLQTSAFRQKNSNTILFGKQWDKPIGILTDGGMQNPGRVESEWEKL